MQNNKEKKKQFFVRIIKKKIKIKKEFYYKRELKKIGANKKNNIL